MQIVVNQIKSSFKNEFEIFANKEKKYIASTPILQIQGGIPKIDKKLPIKIADLNTNILFESTYNAVDNFKEEFIPFKYVATGEQKFDQFVFKNNNGNEECQIYFSQQQYLKGNYVIKKDNKIYEIYSKSTGYYINVPIYYEGNQIAEIVKLNVITDGNDKYTIFLKDEYGYLANSLIAFTLYIDRLYFNYSFTKKSTYITYSKTYSKNDDKYNPNWLKENFDTTEFYRECDQLLDKTRNKISKVFMITGISILIVILIVSILLLFNK